MADIWLSYPELGDLCAASAEAARAQTVAHGWPRRRCSDGTVRVKLPEDLAHHFMTRSVLALEPEAMADVSLHRLKAVAAHMARTVSHADQPILTTRTG